MKSYCNHSAASSCKKLTLYVNLEMKKVFFMPNTIWICIIGFHPVKQIICLHCNDYGDFTAIARPHVGGSQRSLFQTLGISLSNKNDDCQVFAAAGTISHTMAKRLILEWSKVRYNTTMDVYCMRRLSFLQPLNYSSAVELQETSFLSCLFWRRSLSCPVCDPKHAPVTFWVVFGDLQRSASCTPKAIGLAGY